MKALFSPTKSSQQQSTTRNAEEAGEEDSHNHKIDIDQESVEVNVADSVLPLHAQDALRLYGASTTTSNAAHAGGGGGGAAGSTLLLHRSSSLSSLSQQQDGGGGIIRPAPSSSISTNSSSIEVGPADEEEETETDEHSLPSPEVATSDLEVNTKQPVATTVVAAGNKGDSFEQEADATFPAKGKRRRQQQQQQRRRLYCCIAAGICVLLILASVLVGVLLVRNDDGSTGIEENQVVIDIDNPNDFPPTPAPVRETPNNDNEQDIDSSSGNNNNNNNDNDFPYLPDDDTTPSNKPITADPVDQTNYCPIMEGKIVNNFTMGAIRLGERIDNTTLIGSNNNPNITKTSASELLSVLPPCQDNKVYGRGKWFLVQGPGAVVRASTCQSMGLVWADSTSALGGIPLDTQLSVFTSQTETCSDGLECVTGNDDASCGTQSFVSWYAEKDRMYYVFVSAKPTGLDEDPIIDEEEENDDDEEEDGQLVYPVGTFGLTLELAPIGTCDAAIDYRSEATAVSRVVLDPDQQTQVPKDSSLIVGTLLGANFGLDPCVPGQWLGRGGEIWYRVTGTGRWIMASTCSSTLANEFPPRLALYFGNCDQLQCAVAKASDFAPSVDRDCGFGYSLNWWARMGEEYFLMIFKMSHLPGIQFGLTVEDLNPPINDNCTGAVRLFADGTVTYGSTLRATYIQEQIAPTCTLDDVRHSHPGVWYRVLGTGTRLTASLCNEVTEFDTKISVYEGSCGNLRCVIANDQWCGYQSSVYWESALGQMYFVLVHGSTGGTSASIGDFGLTVFEFKPSINDYCTDAILVQPGSVTQGSTSTASADEYVDSCDFTGASHRNQAPGVWYKVFGTGTGMRASTCGSETTYDTRISVYRGADCQQLQCVVSDDNGCGFQSSAYWFSNEGETYYILVTGNLFSSFGDFVLRVEDYSPNTINDFCANAITASTTTVNLGSTRSATFDGVETCVVSNTAPGIWYKVEGSGTGMVASTCHIVTDFDTRISVFRGSDCEALECVAGNDDSHQSSDCGASAGSRVSWLSTLGENYHILVHGWGALVGTFGLTIEEVVPLVANDFCITSSPVQVTLGSNSSSQPLLTQGTTIDATVDNVPICGDVESIGHGVWYQGVGTGNRLMASTCNDLVDERDDNNFATFSTTMPGVVTDFDTQISVFRGGCRNLECLGANNDRCGLQSSVNFFIEEGEPFFVLVHGNVDSKGSFGLVINEIFPQVANDFCDMATNFAIAHNGGTNRLVGSTAEASYDTVEECIVKNTAPGVWYRTTGTGEMVTVTTCGGQTDFDTRLSVYTGSCQFLECVTGNDDTSRDTASCGLASTATWQSVEGQTYYIRVHGWGSLTGNFQLSIYETEAS